MRLPPQLLVALGLLIGASTAFAADKPLLTAVLTYHVVPAKVPAASVPVGKAITSVQGGVFKIESTGGLKITDGRNRVANITASRAMPPRPSFLQIDIPPTAFEQKVYDQRRDADSFPRGRLKL